MKSVKIIINNRENDNTFNCEASFLYCIQFVVTIGLKRKYLGYKQHHTVHKWNAWYTELWRDIHVFILQS